MERRTRTRAKSSVVSDSSDAEDADDGSRSTLFVFEMLQTHYNDNGHKALIVNLTQSPFFYLR